MNRLTALKIYIVALLVIATFIPFGSSNIMIPIACILLVPTLATEDYKADKIKNMPKMFITFLVLSIGASIIGLNLYIGVAITFIISFGIYYIYTYEDKKSKAISYMLYYVLILSVPINKHEIILRLSACIYGAIISIVLYYTLSKVDFLKKADSTVEEAYENLNTAILLKLQNDNYYDFLLKALSQSVIADGALIRRLYKFSKNTDIILKKELTLDLMKSLGSIINKTEDNKVLRDISRILKWIIRLYKDEISIVSFKQNLHSHIYLSSGYETELIKKHIKNFLDIYDDEILADTKKYGKNYIKNIIKKYDDEFNLHYGFKASMKSLRFNIAIKGAIILSIATFVIYFLSLTNGKWIIFTLIATYIPFAGAGIKKIKSKILATVIGFIVINIVITYISSGLIMFILLIASGYFALTSKSYTQQILLTTFCAVGGYSLLASITYTSFGFDRYLYVIIGGILTLIITKYVSPINAKWKIRDIYKSYVKLNEQILSTVEEKSVEELFNELQSGKKKNAPMELNEILIIYRILLMRSRFLSSFIKTKYAERFDIKEALIIGDFKNITRADNHIKEPVPVTYSSLALVEKLNEFKKPVKKNKRKPKKVIQK